jgi:hypothetical protein
MGFLSDGDWRVEMNRKGSPATVSGRFLRGYIWDIPMAYACDE